ncbi:hypothetical protein V1T75_00975 [Tenacibaculum sp. FZY0031]|uniref:hypothetical protein n=1 Tax=Tenacibaculum sp. FZY0031 TaxID=3116648 RepID=UPI002EBABC3C|nr:hypothetical protein [Tenacibaculum sp. FZY0031]
MKLDQVKNLGKELTKSQLKEATGGRTWYYQCADGRSGQIRNGGDTLTENPCGDVDGEAWSNG